MARKSKKSKGRHVGGHKFGGRAFQCYGKRVRSGKSKKKTARIFCSRDQKK